MNDVSKGELNAARSFLGRKGYDAVITPQKFIRFCKDTDLGFHDAWFELQSELENALDDKDFHATIKKRYGGKHE